MNPTYEAIGPLERANAEKALESEDESHLRRTLVSIAMHEEDWQWVQRKLERFAANPSRQVRHVVATCYSHLARARGRPEIDLEKAVPILELLARDEELRGHVCESAEDVGFATGIRVVWRRGHFVVGGRYKRDWPDGEHGQGVPKAVLRVAGADTRFGGAACGGALLAAIVAEVAAASGDLSWFGSDVDAADSGALAALALTTKPVEIGSSAELSERARRTERLVAGVFLAVVPGTTAAILADVEVASEDPPFRPLGGALVEVRAFEATYFEVYGADGEMLCRLQATLGGKVEGWDEYRL